MRLFAHATFAAALSLVLGAGQSAPAQNTKTALSAGNNSNFPGSSYDFEKSTILAGNFVYSPQWSPWTMGAGTGIAANGSLMTMESPDAPPTGIRVAFIQGAGTMSTPFTFAAGTWRLRFRGTQRVQSGAFDRQVLRITVVENATQVSREIFEEELAGSMSEYATYKTRAFTFAASTQTTVYFQGVSTFPGDNTALLDNIKLEPIRNWNSASTWTPSGIPGSGHDVVIPEGVEVALRGTALVATVTVSGELLTSFEDAELSTRWIGITGQAARFEVGRELTPFDQVFKLKLTGDNTSEDALMAGSKFLMAKNGGTIEMHGTPRGIVLPDGRRRTWTKLAATAAVASNQLVLTEPVNWRVDDEIVIAGSNQADPLTYVDQSEKHKILSIGGGGTILTLYGTLANAHFGASTPYVYNNGVRSWTLDRRAEVGLLTHNVRVEGVIGANPTFGGHVMMMRGQCCTSTFGGQGRFSNVELFQMGQKKSLGRYPMHWHMLVDQGAGQFMKSCSVHQSFNRAITVHGTESVVVEGNVAFDHVGHGMFLEDGSERFNKLYHNLALRTVKPALGDELLPSDNSHNAFQNRTPATYWLTNPNNEFVGNVAAGTVGTGFWFIFAEAPTGLSATQPYSGYFPNLHPDHEPLGLFADNVCHSSSSGFDVNDGIEPNHEIQPNHGWVPPSTAYLDRFTVYACWEGLYAGAAADVYEMVRFRDSVLADNLHHMIFAAHVVVEQSAVIAHSPSGFFTQVRPKAYMAYDGPGRVFDTHFVGWTGGASLLGEFGAAERHTGHRLHGLTFDPPQQPAIGLPDYTVTPQNFGDVNDPQESRRWGTAIVDEDGSLSGQPGWTIISNHPMMRSLVDVPNASVLIPQWSNTFASPFKFAHLLLYHPGLDTSCGPNVPFYCNLPTVTLNRFLRGHTPVSFVNGYYTDVHKQHAVIVNDPAVMELANYSIDWQALPSTKHIELVLNDLFELPTGTFLKVALDGIAAFATVVVDRPDGTPVTAYPSLAALDAGTTTGYFLDSNAPSQPVYVRFVKPAGAMTEKVRVVW